VRTQTQARRAGRLAPGPWRQRCAPTPMDFSSWRMGPCRTGICLRWTDKRLNGRAGQVGGGWRGRPRLATPPSACITGATGISVASARTVASCSTMVASEILIEHQADGFLKLTIIFDNHHPTLSVGTGRPRGWYEGTGRRSIPFQKYRRGAVSRLNHSRQVIVDRAVAGTGPVWQRARQSVRVRSAGLEQPASLFERYDRRDTSPR